MNHKSRLKGLLPYKEEDQSFFFGREWQMDFAHHGQTGLTQALSHSYDVIVLDIMLPGLNGIELCKLFRQQSQYLTPIIMLTARG